MLRGIWTFLVLIVATAVFGLTSIVLTLVRRSSEPAGRLGQAWARTMLRAVAVRPEYRGVEHLNIPPPYLFVANHQSWVDIWALYPALPSTTRAVVKRALFRIPVLGTALRLGGFVPVDRHKLGRAIKSLGVAGDEVRSGRPFLLFAEGTRSRDGRLGPFKKGPFHLALAARVPLIPVGISGAGSVMSPGSLRVRPGPVRVSFGAPLDVHPYLPDDVDGLRRAARDAVARELDPAEVGPGDLSVGAAGS